MTNPLEIIKKPSWKIRRRLVNGILAFCGAEILLVTIAMFGWLDPAMIALAQTIVLGAFGLAGSTIGSYIFGAAWDDKNHRGGRWRDWDRYERPENPDNSEEPG